MTDRPIPRVGLIGCGRWGRNVARALARLGALEAIADPAPQVAPLAAELGARRVTDPHALFADPAVEAVAIAAPAADHARLVREALGAGLPVFVEKPLSLTLADAEACAQAAIDADRPLMVGHLLQYHPAFVRLVRSVEAGDIGALRALSSNRLSPGAIRTEETALFSLAPHDVSMVLRLCGPSPREVQAMCAEVSGAGVADAYWANLEFDSGVRAHLQVSWLSPYKEQRLTLIGERGALVFEDTAADPTRKLLLFRDPIDRSGAAPAYRKSAGEPLAFDPVEPLIAEMTAFLAAVQGKAPPLTGPQEAIPVLRTLHLIEEAARRVSRPEARAA